MDLAKYYEEICRIPILTRTEEEQLFAKFHSNQTSLK